MTNEIAIELTDRLKAAGLDKFSGSIFYSGAETISSGSLYLLGYNPGGDPAEITADPVTQLQGVLRKKDDWNEYIDGDWSSVKRKYDPGEAPMQLRVRALIKGIGLPLTEICASNLIFVRSRDVNRLSRRDDLAERCWPIHEFILDKIKPRAILSIGGTAVFDFIRLKGQQLADRTDSLAARHGNWKCYATKVQIGGTEMSLVSVPHLSRYAVDRHPDVIQWVRGMLFA